MTRPMRSLTEPPGFRCSSFPRIVGRRPLPSLESRTSGVLPTRPRMSSAIFTAATLALPLLIRCHPQAVALDHQGLEAALELLVLRLDARHDLALRQAERSGTRQVLEVL